MTRVASVRMSDAEYAALEQAAEIASLSISELVREAVMTHIRAGGWPMYVLPNATYQAENIQVEIRPWQVYSTAPASFIQNSYLRVK